MSVSMKSTKNELLAEVQRLNNELARAQEMLINTTPVITATIAVEPQPFMATNMAGWPNRTNAPQWQIDRANAMAAARAQAMGSRSVVKV